MGPRRVTISCPGCRQECVDVTVDEAESILFNGCDDCQSLGTEASVEREADESGGSNGGS